MGTKLNIHLIFTGMIILLWQLLTTLTVSQSFINYKISYLDSNTVDSLVSTAKQFSSWRQIYGSSYEDDENTGGAGHGSLTDLENRINHHFTSGYGVNCSGFVRAVIYHTAGVDVMHKGIYIEDVVNSGYFTEISESQIKPGDIFYTIAGSSGHHIGIVTEVLGFDRNGTATFRTAESDSGNWTRVITKYDYYAGAGQYKFLRLNSNITRKSNLEAIINWGKYSEEYKISSEISKEDCIVIKGSVKIFLHDLFMIISIVGIILLIIMSAVEFIKAITSFEDSGIKKALKNTIFRIICIMILLLLPMLVNWIINVINTNLSPEYKIGSDGEPICGIDR